VASRDIPPIGPNALHSWEEFDTPFVDGPHTVDEVVAELLSRPPGEVRIRPIVLAPVRWFAFEGDAFGVRFRLILVPRSDGSGWFLVHDIHCLGGVGR
jgi:hypothetical protein